MDGALRKRRTLKGKLTRIQTIVDGFGDNVVEPRLAERYKKQLDQLWTELNEIQEELGSHCTDVEYAECQIEYDLLAGRIETLQLRFPDHSIGTTNNGDGSEGARNTVHCENNVRLPRLELPTFSGSFHEWSSFHDLFTSTIVNNERLSGAQRLQYLKTSLRGEAFSLLQAIQVTNDNFEEAWDILKKRYHNKKEIVNAHLRRLCTQPAIVAESPAALRKLIDTTNETVRALKVLNLPVEHWDAILVHLVAERLDSDSRRQWELSASSMEIDKYAEFIAFLEIRARALTTCLPSRALKGSMKPSERRHSNTASYYGDVTGEECRICKAKHPIYRCTELLQGSYETRRALIRDKGLCFNCLSHDHLATHCKASSCRKCGARHHTLLHKMSGDSGSKPKETIRPSPDRVLANHGSTEIKDVDTTHVLLATALVKIKDTYGNNQVCRTLLDSGSQATFISEACAQRLGLTRRQENMFVTGIGSSSRYKSRGSVDLSISSCVEIETKIFAQAYVLSKVTGPLPGVPCKPTNWDLLTSLKLADPKYHLPNVIDVLLGADIVAEILRPGLLRKAEGTLIAQASSLGWLLSGRIESQHVSNNLTVNSAQIDLLSTVQRFWELEEVPFTKQYTEEQKLCEEHFVTTHSRDKGGRFVVKLPFKTREVVLDSNETRHVAIRRLLQLEQRLREQPRQRQEYQEFLMEYEQLHHMEELSEYQVCNSYIFLPHHAVIKESSSTTRLRVVFDASARVRNGASLNNHLMTGATLQDDVFNIIIRFRTHLIAMTADITKMYRQIRVLDSDTRFQCIVWRDLEGTPIKHYRLLTLTYGMTSAPFLATRCLQQLAIEGKAEFPKAAEVVQKDFYIDDLMTGADTLEEALLLKNQLIALLDSGGFPLRKWASNSTKFLDTVSPILREPQNRCTIGDEEVIKTLGLSWNPTSDNFSFRLATLPENVTNTKRTLLSTIARIYDPLGWLTPVTIRAKLLIQQLWRTPSAWDDCIPDEVNSRWNRYLRELQHIETVKIPRSFTTQIAAHQSLHGFCDASESAYAAVIYMRSMLASGEYEVTLIAAKSRVAPIKTISLPRLELCGALLLAKLFVAVQSALLQPISEIHAWTDSTIVLAWIHDKDARWKTFVANRVSAIQSKVAPNLWHHVRGSENPADCASRGIDPSQLKTQDCWWKGPVWLSNPQLEITPYVPRTKEEEAELELKVSLVNSTSPCSSLLSRYSSLLTLTTVTSFIFRFIKNCRVSKDERVIGPPTLDEKIEATNFWIKGTQQEVFPVELRCLLKGDALPRDSRLLSLSPFLDSHGIIRVGGRLRNAPIHADRKHPIILPRKHAFTSLVVRQEHLRILHAGPQSLLASLRQRFWILCGRDVARHFVRNCVTCQRYRAEIQRPLMGDLPIGRVTLVRPFQRVGVDYAGPFVLRALKIRGQKTYKAYVALFVCLTTHAFHLEVVSDLSTSAFIAALKRFTARRGHCSHIHSDQGTNFVGANKELKQFIRLMSSKGHHDTVNRYLQESGTVWHFNPPASPHFGGLWEAGVKSIKFHLRRVVGNVVLNYEEMSTVLTQVEACLNSRPLCPLSSSPDDLEVLTPGHFLIGKPLTTIAEPDYSSIKLSRLSRWQLLQRLYQQFWKRWSQEYLSRLQQRPKAWISSSSIAIDDLVLLKDENLPPARWKMGRILRLFPGSDGIVRVVLVKTATGELKRPVVKLCKLMMDTPKQE